MIKRSIYAHIWEQGCSRLRVQQVQRSCGGNELDVNDSVMEWRELQWHGSVVVGNLIPIWHSRKPEFQRDKLVKEVLAPGFSISAMTNLKACALSLLLFSNLVWGLWLREVSGWAHALTGKHWLRQRWNQMCLDLKLLSSVFAITPVTMQGLGEKTS